MTRLLALAFLCFAVLSGCTAAQEAKSTDFPEDFAQKAMDHVQTLVEFGPRVAGSTAERNVASHLRDQFATLGLETWIEPFQFEGFAIKEVTLAACAAEVTPTMIGFNPYNGGLILDAPPMFVQPDIGSDDLSKLQLTDRCGRLERRYNTPLGEKRQ